MKNFSYGWTGYITLVILLIFSAVMSQIDPHGKQLLLGYITAFLMIVAIVFAIIGFRKDDF